MRIVPIVEGHGEVSAVPVLLRRLREEARVWEIDVARPIRRHRSDFDDEQRVRRAVRLATFQSGCAAVLILFDADAACAKEKAPQVEAWARAAAGTVPCAVVMATREYEAWFLASIESLRGKGGVRKDAEPHANPEAPQGAKEALEDRMMPGQSYSESADQASLTAALDLPTVHARCRSFRRLVRAFGLLARAAGCTLPDWPPPSWRVNRP